MLSVNGRFRDLLSRLLFGELVPQGNDPGLSRWTLVQVGVVEADPALRSLQTLFFRSSRWQTMFLPTIFCIVLLRDRFLRTLRNALTVADAVALICGRRFIGISGFLDADSEQ
jgi:hypothetical protein